MRISDWSSDGCSSDLAEADARRIIALDRDRAGMDDSSGEGAAGRDAGAAGADGIGAVLVAVLVDILALVAFVDDDLAGGAVGDRTGDAGFGKDAGGAIGVADLDRAVVHDLVIAVDGDRGAAGRLARTLTSEERRVGKEG